MAQSKWSESPEAKRLRAAHATARPHAQRAAALRYQAFASLVEAGDSPARAYAKVAIPADTKRAAEDELAERKARAKRARAKQLEAFEAATSEEPAAPLTREERVKQARVEARRREITAGSAAAAGVVATAPSFAIVAAPSDREQRHRAAQLEAQRQDHVGGSRTTSPNRQDFGHTQTFSVAKRA